MIPRFGNYIGEAVESDEEAHDEAKPQAFAFDEAFEDEEDEEAQDQQLMEVDGVYPLRSARFSNTDMLLQRALPTPLSYTKINNTILQRNKYMVQMSKLWCKRKIHSRFPSPSSRPSNKRSSPSKKLNYRPFFTRASL